MKITVGYLATPSGDDGVALATALARALDASIDIVLVMAVDDPVMEGSGPYRKVLEARAKGWVDDAAAQVPSGIEVTTHVLSHESFARALIDFAVHTDADLIVGDVLIELKTKLGRKDDEGQRFDVLQTKDLYQVVAYALFDRSDEYGIRDVAIYSARYGHYFERRLDTLLDELAGRPVDLPAERTRVWQILATA